MHPFSLHRAARSLGLLSVGVLSTLGALSLSHIGPASAQSPGVNLAALVAEVKALQKADDAQAKVNAEQAQAIANLETLVTQQAKRDDELQRTVAGQADQITALQKTGQEQAKLDVDLQTRTAPLSVSGTTLTIKGVNVQIVNGGGATDSVNGLGNLIIGYNAVSSEFNQARTGSHNLILGDANNYLSYGGLVAGFNNAVTAPYATITGGERNLASSDLCSVSGGENNQATNEAAMVSGGESNVAAGRGASVTGGIANRANGQDSAVSGGFHNAADGINAAVAGGIGGAAVGDNSAVSGGTGVRSQGGYTPVFDPFGNLIGSTYHNTGNGFTWVGAGLASH